MRLYHIASPPRALSPEAASHLTPIPNLYPSLNTPLTPQAKDAHASVVRSYSAPATPSAPALPTDLAAELSKFDATEPTLGNKASAAAAPTSSEDGQSAAEYLKFLEADLPKPDHH
jgi:F-type H+-transporting ATPase subunit h